MDLKAARLVADVGGTNARMGWQAAKGGPITDVEVYPCANYPSLQAVIETYLQKLGRGTPAQACVGIACPVNGDFIQMTNNPWGFSIQAMKAALGLERLLVINDFTAQAMAILGVPREDLRQIGGGQPLPNGPMGVIGPGTGLGVSGLLRFQQGGWVPLMGEGGHVTLPATTAEESAVVERLIARFGHASAERAISGQGLENIHQALCEIDGVPVEGLSAADVSGRALSGSDERCVRALNLMCEFLGTVTGNLALTLGAVGGVYLVGGILPRMADYFDQSNFRARFEAKGRYAKYMSQIPTWLVTSTTSPALMGAANALDEM